MSDNNSNNASKIENSSVEEIVANNTGEPENLSLEALIMLINTSRLNQLRDKTNQEFGELHKRQEQVATLHNLLKKINTNTSNDGTLDCSSNNELQELLKQAKGMNVDLKEDQKTYTKDERDRLVDNIRMTVDDLNVKNDMQLQSVNRLTNERYESYQMARSIIKPLHEAKMQIARNTGK